jgi:2TM domain
MSIDEKAGARDAVPATDGSLRARAVARLRNQAAFRTHLMVYIAVNLFLVAIWWLTARTFFWPIFPIGGWGIGIVAHGWDAYGPDRLTEDRIRREMDRLER